MTIKNLQENKKVPNLRFKNFFDVWQEKNYEDIFLFKNTNSYSRDDLNYISGEVKNIHYGDIHQKNS
jgi:type I restriction enzyme S subunit